MKGFIVGSLGLIVLYVVVQPGAAGAAETASGWLQQGMRRWLSPKVAGVPDRTKKASPAAAPAAGRYYSV